MSTISSELKFRKEFEDILLTGNLDEALKTLPQEDEGRIYIEFCEEYKKCCASKRISRKLNGIIKAAENNYFSQTFIKILKTKKDLLEYDLNTTIKKKKNDILKNLYDNYCDNKFDYSKPFFVREKKADTDEQIKKINNTPKFLTEKMINEAYLKIINKNKTEIKYEIKNTPENKRHILFLKYLEKKDYELCSDILDSYIEIPFYLINKKGFSKIIDFFNETKKDIKFFVYNKFTTEQIKLLLLEQVTNKQNISINDLINILINKEYNKLIKRAKKEHNLTELKNILWKIYEIYQEYNPYNKSGILLYILKLNKDENIYDLKPLLEYLKEPLIDVFYSHVYKNKVRNAKLVKIDYLFDIYDTLKENFLEDLLIDFLIYDKAKMEDFRRLFKQDYLDKIKCIVKMYKGDDVKSDIYRRRLENFV